jgi:hypothetical protein
MRPSLPIGHDFDDLIATENVCRDGFYAPAIIARYKKQMRVFVTFPYSVAHGAINREYVGEVVRLENLPDGHIGIAVHLLSPLSLTVHDGASAGRKRASHILWRVPKKRTP